MILAASPFILLPLVLQVTDLVPFAICFQNVFTCGLDQQTFRTWAEFNAHNLAAHNMTADYLPYA